jgi:hypothetical protein
MKLPIFGSVEGRRPGAAFPASAFLYCEMSMENSMVKDSKANEVDALVSLDRKLRLVADRVTGVVRGHSTGLYLCGSGGLGKSYAVVKQLQTLEADFRVFNSRMSAKGLFQALQKAPDSIHVLKDMERLTCDRDAQGVLRSALWSQGDQKRVITWTTSEGEQRFTFRGGIIMLANRPLADLPELRALATRISIHLLQISDQEMKAQMRRIASQGWSRYHHHLEAEKSVEVCEFVIRECRTANCPLDLRLFDNACTDYLLWESSNSACHWKDLVSSRVRQAAAHFRQEVSLLSAEERKAAERDIARDIMARTTDSDERIRLWTEATGKQKSTFYNRKREIESGEFNV